MGGSQPRIGLNLKVAQKQILTPGLVQMVNVLALNLALDRATSK